MTFESMITTFSSRFLSDRSFELIVAPALADFQFEDTDSRRGRVATRVAVLRAVSGAVHQELRGGSADFLKLTLLSFCYFIFPLALGIRIFRTWSDFAVAATVVLVMSLVPVMVCFWPDGRVTRPTE
jgi:hypothetical protein